MKNQSFQVKLLLKNILVAMVVSSTISSSSATNVFEVGKHKTVLITVEAETCRTTDSSSLVSPPPPKPLLIGTPSEEEAGEYPVLVFLHGYLLYNSFYSQLIQHIASHGFIVIAPQLYSLAGPDTTEEVKSTAAITNWLPQGLKHHLPPQVHPNLDKIALSGHSRGGKVSFALALGKVPSASTTPKFTALIGIDPVDGMDKGIQTPPPVLTYVPHSFDLDMPVLVIGSGLGSVRRNPLFPPCAPKGVNHEEFYNACEEPACYFVVKDYGHLDMLDDETKGIRGRSSYCLCKNGKSRGPMRRFVGGAVVAFLEAYLNGDSKDLLAIRFKHDEIAPVELEKVDFLD